MHRVVSRFFRHPHTPTPADFRALLSVGWFGPRGQCPLAGEVGLVPAFLPHRLACDQTIALDGHYAKPHYPERLRRIRLRDAETGKMLVFLTNKFDLPALTIAALYKNRCKWSYFSNGSSSTFGSSSSIRPACKICAQSRPEKYAFRRKYVFFELRIAPFGEL